MVFNDIPQLTFTLLVHYSSPQRMTQSCKAENGGVWMTRNDFNYAKTAHKPTAMAL